MDSGACFDTPNLSLLHIFFMAVCHINKNEIPPQTPKTAQNHNKKIFFSGLAPFSYFLNRVKNMARSQKAAESTSHRLFDTLTVSFSQSPQTN